MEGQMDRPYFIGPFRLPPGVQKEHGNYRQITNSVLLNKLLNKFALKTLRKETTFQLSAKNKKLCNLPPRLTYYYHFVSFRLTTVVMITQILYKMISKLFIRL